MKPKNCKACGKEFTPRTGLQKVCGLQCSIDFVKQEKLRKAKKEARQARREFKQKDRSFRLKKAQEAFNAFIRSRDEDKPCVSCGRYHNGQYHAGHYQPVGRQPSLRFNEINCHKQCAPCNNHQSGNLVPFREELIRRIGLPLVEWLEQDHPKTKPWTAEELLAIERYYKDALKQKLADPMWEPFPF